MAYPVIFLFVDVSFFRLISITSIIESMGHSDISVTMNVYTNMRFDDAEEELKRMEEFRKAQAEIEKKSDAKAIS